MEKFTKVSGTAISLLRANIDTDAILPSRYLTRTTVTGKSGFGPYLFADWRYESDGKDKADFVLNRPENRDAKILLAADNFGCGSSREHAVWALVGYGIRCVIAPSFGEIFYTNSFNNGLLPLQLPLAQIESLAAQLEKGNRQMTVDLQAQTLTAPDGAVIKLTVDPARRDALLNGLDAIGLTMQTWDQISAWQAKDKARRPWSYL
jgi:3-isopropylmalate/(R)-2-methylmalate dehydratase small subunit